VFDRAKKWGFVHWEDEYMNVVIELNYSRENSRCGIGTGEIRVRVVWRSEKWQNVDYSLRQTRHPEYRIRINHNSMSVRVD
jgi:hypothetical protein